MRRQHSRPWTDSSLPPEQRVEALLAAMTLEEKLAQLGSIWDRTNRQGGNVAPMEDVFNYGQPFEVLRSTASGK